MQNEGPDHTGRRALVFADHGRRYVFSLRTYLRRLDIFDSFSANFRNFHFAFLHIKSHFEYKDKIPFRRQQAFLPDITFILFKLSLSKSNNLACQKATTQSSLLRRDRDVHINILLILSKQSRRTTKTLIRLCSLIRVSAVRICHT